MISIDNITKYYGTQVIFKQASCTIPCGVTLVLGENGAGKTTLLQLITGQETLHDGTIHCPENVRCAYMGHTLALYPQFTAFENLQFWAQLYDIPSALEDILALLQRVNLLQAKDKKVALFSRGMQQRLELARILLQRPSLLLLDEPTTGLDVASIQLLHKELLYLAQHDVNILWITHAYHQDKPLAHNVLLVRDARLTLYSLEEYEQIFSS